MDVNATMHRLYLNYSKNCNIKNVFVAIEDEFEVLGYKASHYDHWMAINSFKRN